MASTACMALSALAVRTTGTIPTSVINARISFDVISLYAITPLGYIVRYLVRCAARHRRGTEFAFVARDQSRGSASEVVTHFGFEGHYSCRTVTTSSPLDRKS